VLEIALTGDKDKAESAVTMDSEYRMISGELTREMMAWKGSVLRAKVIVEIFLSEQCG